MLGAAGVQTTLWVRRALTSSPVLSTSQSGCQAARLAGMNTGVSADGCSAGFSPGRRLTSLICQREQPKPLASTCSQPSGSQLEFRPHSRAAERQDFPQALPAKLTVCTPAPHRLCKSILFLKQLTWKLQGKSLTPGSRGLGSFSVIFFLISTFGIYYAWLVVFPSVWALWDFHLHWGVFQT